MFGTAQPVRIITRVKLGDGPARPGQPLQARFPFDMHAMLARHRQDSARPFDHHCPRLVDAGRDQCNSQTPVSRQSVDPFGPRPRLAKAAPGHHQPHPPAFPIRGKLRIVRAKLEIRVQLQQLGRRQALDHRALLSAGKAAKPQRLVARQHPSLPSAISVRMAASRPAALLVSIGGPPSRARNLSSRSKILSRISASSSSAGW